MQSKSFSTSFLNTTSDVIVATRKVVADEWQSLVVSPHLPASLQIDVQTENVKRRKELVVGRFLLAELLYHYCQVEVLPEIAVTANNKPFFCNPLYPYFNISHSNNRVAVAICNKGAVGLDIELHRPLANYQKISQSLFSAKEHDWLQSHSNPEVAFWQLWTVREAAVKLYGKGIWQMKQVQYHLDTAQMRADFAGKFHCHYELREDWHMALCTKYTAGPVDIIHL